LGEASEVRRDAAPGSRSIGTYGIRSWDEVAKLYSERTGEQIDRVAASRIAAEALAKIRVRLIDDPLVRERVGLSALQRWERNSDGLPHDVLLLARRSPGGMLTPRAVRQRVLRFRGDPGGARDALDALAEAGYGRWLRTRRSGLGRPSEVFVLDARHRIGLEQ
jgi:hypothetical protein